MIIGDEISKYATLRRAVHRHKLHKHVRFFGFVPDKTLAVLYRLAAVFVFPSLYEGFGLPPLEAMASGTPVITSNVSSLPEVVGDAAVLIDPYQPDEIADAMERVLTDEALRRRPSAARPRAGPSLLLGSHGAARARDLCRGSRALTKSDSAERSPDSSQRESPAAPRVAVVHDWLTGMRGGEKVLEAICELFPGRRSSPLVRVPGSVSPALEGRSIGRRSCRMASGGRPLPTGS